MGITFTIGQEEFLLGFFILMGSVGENLSGVGNPTSIDKQFQKSYRTWHFVPCVPVNKNVQIRDKRSCSKLSFFSCAKLSELETEQRVPTYMTGKRKMSLHKDQSRK